MKIFHKLLIAFTFAIVGFSQLAYSGVAPCDKDNYLEYIFNSELMDQHIEQYKTGCNLQKVDLEDENLRGADLRGADLWAADLRHTDLIFADLSGANLPYAKLWGADLRYADLTGANLKGASLIETDLGSTDLRGANLHGVATSFLNVMWFIPTNFTDAKYNRETIFTKDFQIRAFSPQKHGMIEVS